MTIDALAAALADRYRIEREIGVGGMATVYLAQDVKHHRKVAIKVLHPELSAVIGSERFLKEIELTANLQHPHILPLFDSGLVEGREGRGGRDADESGPSSPSTFSTPPTFLYYVMPYVEGETLRHRLERERQLSVSDVVRITTEVADALDYAHRHGAVHRDIKPENILLHDGRPVVADFGIALAVQHAGGARMTQTGMSLGTPQYMAPEQAMGDRNVDHRVDIYALGAVAYEMLAGEPPFTGPSSQAIVARVMTERPRGLRAIRDTIPAHVADAVHTALQKLPADRFPSAAEFARALASPAFHAPEDRAAEAIPRSALRTDRRSGALGLLVLVLAGLAAWGWLRSGSSRAPTPGWRVAIPFPDSAPPTTGLDLSADGSVLVYGGGAPDDRRIWVRRAGAPHPLPLPGTEGGESPALSPDGRRVAFRRGFSVFVVPLEGGTPTLASDSMMLAERLHWVDGDHLMFSNFAGIELVDVPTASRELLIPRDTLSGFYASPMPLPSGDILFTAMPRDNTVDLSGFNIAVAAPGERPAILMRGVRARFLPPNHLFVLRSDGSLVHLPFDVSRRRVTGPGRAVISGIPVMRGSLSGAFDVVESGRTVLIVGGTPRGVPPQDLVRVRRSGTAVAIDTAWVQAFLTVAVSPDGRRIAAGASEGSGEQILLRESLSGGRSRIIMPSLQLRSPAFSPDGERLVFAGLGAHGMGIYQARADGGTPPELIVPTTEPVTAPAFAPDGRSVYYSTFGAAGDVFLQRLGADSAGRKPVIATRALERYGFPSRDGAWLAYTSDESGQVEVYVRASDPARTERWQLTQGGVDRAAMPRWSRDGSELFLIVRDTMVALRIAPGPAFSVVRRTALFPTRPYQEAFDVFPGGDFLMLRQRPVNPHTQQLVMLEHWNTEAGR